MHPKFIVTIKIIVLPFMSLNIILIYKSKSNINDAATKNDNNDDKDSNNKSGRHLILSH